MDLASFVVGLVYAYLGIFLVLLLQDQYRALCRNSVGYELLGASFWPVTVWPALLLWWWQRRRAVPSKEWPYL
jgi:hypothetical protein